MLSRFENHGLVWVDLESPSREEVETVVKEFHINHVIGEELLLPSTKPRAEFYEGYVYAIMHFPALRHSHKSREQEVDFIIGRNFIITARYDIVDSLHKFSKIVEVNSILDKSSLGEHAGFLFFAMLLRLYKAIEHETEYIRHDLAVIEEHIFSEHEIQMVSAISRAARDLLNLRQTIEPHRDVLHELETGGARLFGDDFLPYLRMLSNEYYRVHNHIMRNTESLHELRETNNSLLSTKQNETIKVLTIMAFVTFPLALIASVLAIDAPGTPFVNTPYGFWIITGIMASAATCMFLYFRRRKWL